LQLDGTPNFVLVTSFKLYFLTGDIDAASSNAQRRKNHLMWIAS